MVILLKCKPLQGKDRVCVRLGLAVKDYKNGLGTLSVGLWLEELTDLPLNTI